MAIHPLKISRLLVQDTYLVESRWPHRPGSDRACPPATLPLTSSFHRAVGLF